MSIESEQPHFTEEHKEAALRKVGRLEMKSKLQMQLMEEHGIHLSGKREDRERDRILVEQWVEDHSSEDFGRAFDGVMEEHPDLIDIYMRNQEEAMTMLREKFDAIHQHA